MEIIPTDKDQEYPGIEFVAPAAVAAVAHEGLKLRARFRRGGTIIGMTLARELANREDISPRTILRMYSYFARHEVDKKGKDFYNEKRPSNGRIAWMLWGGEPGRAWVTALRTRMRESEGKA